MSDMTEVLMEIMDEIPEGWTVKYNPADYEFSHENGTYGTGSSIVDCIRQINEIESS